MREGAERGGAGRAVREFARRDGDAGAGVRVGIGVRAGVGTAGRHHGELLQGALARDGELVSCLITMPAPGAGSSARYVPGEALAPVPASGPAGEAAQPQLLILPRWKTKAERAARLALAFIGAPLVGRLEIECAVATGVGLGSSTCDVVAAILAVCDAHGVRLSAADVARLAIEAEGAADPIMFEGEAVLFAQRQGRVLESFGRWIPAFTVLSLDTDVGGAGIDTLALPLPDYTTADVNLFESLVARVREAFRRRDADAVAAAATESAMLNQRFLPMRKFSELRAFAHEHRALGIQISHSGTVAGVLFDPQRVPAAGDRAVQLMQRAGDLGVRPLGLFNTG
jgi:uncharacterized protein involved in propanediol utilization